MCWSWRNTIHHLVFHATSATSVVSLSLSLSNNMNLTYSSQCCSSTKSGWCDVARNQQKTTTWRRWGRVVVLLFLWTTTTTTTAVTAIPGVDDQDTRESKKIVDDDNDSNQPPLSKFDAFVAQWNDIVGNGNNANHDARRPPNQELRKLARQLCGTENDKSPPQQHIRRGEGGTDCVGHDDGSHYCIDSEFVKAMDLSSTVVSWDGIHSQWFTEIFVHLPEVQDMMDYGCPMWFFREYALTELLIKYRQDGSGKNDRDTQDDPSSKTVSFIVGAAIDSLDVFPVLASDDVPVTAPASVFVSYSGTYTVKRFVELVHHTDLQGKYLWMDVFCVDQVLWTTIETPKMTAFKEDFTKKQLPEQIAQIGYTAFFLDEWDGYHTALQQIGVLWDLFATGKSNATLQVLLTKEEQAKFVADGLLNAEEWRLGDALVGVDAAKAVSLDNHDKNIILQAMKDNGGISMVNTVVVECMRKWLVQTGRAHLKLLEAGSGEHKEQEINYLMNGLANMFHDQGVYVEAEPLYQTLMARQEEKLGKDHIDTLLSMNNLAILYSDQGRYAEAEPLLSHVLEKYREVLGEIHPHTRLAVKAHELCRLNLAREKSRGNYA